MTIPANKRTRLKSDTVTINGKTHNRRVGHPIEYEPTPEQRRFVEMLVSCGARKTEIAALIINPKSGVPISVSTLENNFGYELQHGAVKAYARVHEALLAKAIGVSAIVEEEEVIQSGKKKIVRKVIRPGVAPEVAAIVWFEKTRRGFRDGMSLEHTGKDGAALPVPMVQVFIPDNGRGSVAKPIADPRKK